MRKSRVESRMWHREAVRVVQAMLKFTKQHNVPQQFGTTIKVAKQQKKMGRKQLAKIAGVTA